MARRRFSIDTSLIKPLWEKAMNEEGVVGKKKESWEALVKEAAQFYAFVGERSPTEEITRDLIWQGMLEVGTFRTIPLSLKEGEDNFFRLFSIIAQCFPDPKSFPEERRRVRNSKSSIRVFLRFYSVLGARTGKSPCSFRFSLLLFKYTLI